jgi:hypothetical protein
LGVVLSIVLALALTMPSESRVERDAIARAFAPVFVFHSQERFFPTTPLFPLELDDVPRTDVRTPAALAEVLGSVDGRVARYERLSLAEKLSIATVHWRVYQTQDADGPVVIAEYWCYYAFNEFKLHGGFVPYVVHDNHRHDLERVFIVLERRKGSTPLGAGEDEEAWAKRTFRIRRIVASAHDGPIAANRFDMPSDADVRLQPASRRTSNQSQSPQSPQSPRSAQSVQSAQSPRLPIEILVERGSHAMAPDINRDGAFTPGIDSSRPRGGFDWGIRDHGNTWSFYRASYMDRRGPHSSIRLCAASEGETGTDADMPADCAPYALASADDLQHWFEDLRPTGADRSRIIGHTSAVVRMFGDAAIEDLMIPKDPGDGRMLRDMLQRSCDSERGLFGGVVAALKSPAAVVGGRINVPTFFPVVPGLLAEAVAIAPAHQKLRAEASLLGYFRADAILKLVGGIGFYSQDQPHIDAVAGFEVRAGRLRVRPTVRLRTGDLDTRIMFVF